MFYSFQKQEAYQNILPVDFKLFLFLDYEKF